MCRPNTEAPNVWRIVGFLIFILTVHLIETLIGLHFYNNLKSDVKQQLMERYKKEQDFIKKMGMESAEEIRHLLSYLHYFGKSYKREDCSVMYPEEPPLPPNDDHPGGPCKDPKGHPEIPKPTESPVQTSTSGTTKGKGSPDLKFTNPRGDEDMGGKGDGKGTTEKAASPEFNSTNSTGDEGPNVKGDDADVSNKCTTPKGEKGTCISLWDCPDLRGGKLNEFACGNVTDYTFCCKIIAPEPTLQESQRDKNLRLLERDIKLQYCGYPHTDDWGAFDYNDPEIQVYEFPWLVYIPLTNYLPELHLATRGKNCVGVLINRKFVLTDISCDGSSAVFGLHSIDEDISCITSEFVTADKDCTRPLLVENIDKKLQLPNSRILLMRLRRPIPYSDHIRPVCLPLKKRYKTQENDTVITSGWGTNEYIDGRTTKVKKRIKHYLMKNDDCEYGNDVTTPVCGVTPLDNEDFACRGDNGGPLVYQYPRNDPKKPMKRNWYLLGIITGRVDCDERQPVVAEGISEEKLEYILREMDSLK